jgi:iron complex transport system ATP-binding protein
VPDWFGTVSGPMSTPPVLRLDDVSFRRDTTEILSGISWSVQRGEHWVVLGRNGSGKTTLAQVASLYEHPSSGTVDVLGERLGRTDVRVLRRRIGFVSASFADRIRPALPAVDVVMTAKFAALEPWWHTYTAEDRARAGDLIASMGVVDRAEHPFGTLSSGERQRVLLARALMTEPSLLLVDEPSAGLDLGGREELVGHFDQMAADPDGPAIVLVTHHVEEIPTRFTHVLALLGGKVLAQGPIADTLNAELLSDCFAVQLEVGRSAGRWWARATTPPE